MTGSELALINALLLKSHGRCCLCLEQDAIILAYIELPEKGGLVVEDNLIPLCPECAESSKIREIPKGQFGTAFTPGELRGHKEASLRSLSKI